MKASVAGIVMLTMMMAVSVAGETGSASESLWTNRQESASRNGLVMILFI